MYKYLHIMHDGIPNGMQNIISFFNTIYDENDHMFVLVSKKENAELRQVKNVLILPTFQPGVILPMIKKSKYVFLHSLFMRIDMKFYMLLHKKQMEKIVWIAFGMDLYNDKKTGKVKSLITEKFKRNIQYFIGIFPPDVDYFQKHYGNRAKAFYVKYAGLKSRALYSEAPKVSLISEKIKSGKPVNILIGHQGNPKLNHMKVIDKIAEFKEENIQVYIPLSYGFSDYADTVEEYAKSKLGDKVTIFRELMSLSAYMEFLETINIAIFDTERQIGMGNITPLIYMQKKMYLNGVMYDYFHDMGIKVCMADSISDYNDFIADVDMSNASNIIRESTALETRVRQWDEVFKELK